MTEVLVPAARLERWVANFESRHGPTATAVGGGALTGHAEDGSSYAARLPFEDTYDGPAETAAFAAAVRASVPDDWGVLLVRKGGYAVARLHGETPVASKTGRRHVQGRSQAGGQSQQRFARRRDNQARDAYQAAADHADRLLAGLGPLVAGGDAAAVAEVLADRRLAGLRPYAARLAVPEPRRAVLDQAVRDALSARVLVVNA